MGNPPARKSPRISSSAPDDSAPAPLYRAARLGTLTVLLVIAAATLWIAAGRTDPPTAGSLVWSESALPWAESALPAEGEVWWAAPEDHTLPPGTFTLSVRARLAPGTSPLAAWGVWIAAQDGSRAVFALDAGGYWTIRACLDLPPVLEDCPAPHPDWRWSPFPRIAAPGDPNTLTLHVEPDGRLRLRLNQERLGAPLIVAAGPWGLWARGGPSGAAIAWERAELRAAGGR